MFEPPSSLYGESLFTSSRAKGARMLFFKQHLQRMVSGVEEYYLGRQMSMGEKGELEERIRNFLSQGGLSAEGNERRVRICVAAKPRKRLIPEEFNFRDLTFSGQNGGLNGGGAALKLKTFQSPFSPFYPSMKMGSYMPLLHLKLKARRQGWDDALLMNGKGNLIEGTTGNLFFYKDGELFSPNEFHLNGVVRQNIQSTRPVKMADISLEKAKDFEGAFLTNSVDIIRPVQSIDHVKFKKIDQQMLQNMLKELLERGYDEKENSS